MAEKTFFEKRKAVKAQKVVTKLDKATKEMGARIDSVAPKGSSVTTAAIEQQLAALRTRVGSEPVVRRKEKELDMPQPAVAPSDPLAERLAALKAQALRDALEYKAANERRVLSAEKEHALKVLQLRAGASLKEIDAQYRALIKKWHPDKFSSPSMNVKATAYIARLNNAYNVLNPKSKRN